MFSTSLSGMLSAETIVNNSAARVATPRTPAPATAGDQSPDTVSLSDEMTSLLQALTSFKANTRALDTESSMAQSTVSIIA